MLKNLIFYSILSENIKTWSLKNPSILEAKTAVLRTEIVLTKQDAK